MWMTRDLVTIGPDTPITDAAALMAQKRIRRLPVVESPSHNAHLLGIVTAKDILHAFPSGVNPFPVIGPDARLTPTRTSEIMGHHLRTATPETPIEEAARLMTENKIGSLPVLRENKLVG
jgi:acetoin utilization protein AcuB